MRQHLIGQKVASSSPLTTAPGRLLPAATARLPRCVQVPYRCLQYRRYGLLLASAATEAAYCGCAAAAWRANPRAALWVLLLPYVISSLALMFGK
jgi:hypothetical protein